MMLCGLIKIRVNFKRRQAFFRRIILIGLCIVDLVKSLRVLSTQAHIPHIFTNILYNETLPASSLAMFSKLLARLCSPNNRLERRVRGLHSPPSPIPHPLSPPLIAQLPDQLHGPTPTRMTPIRPPVPPRLNHHIDPQALQQTVDPRRVVGAVPEEPSHTDIPPRFFNQAGKRLHVVHVVGADPHRDHLVCHGVYGEVGLTGLPRASAPPSLPPSGRLCRWSRRRWLLARCSRLGACRGRGAGRGSVCGGRSSRRWACRVRGCGVRRARDVDDKGYSLILCFVD